MTVRYFDLDANDGSQVPHIQVQNMENFRYFRLEDREFDLAGDLYERLVDRVRHRMQNEQWDNEDRARPGEWIDSSETDFFEQKLLQIKEEREANE